MFVYLIRNSITNKVYVGKTIRTNLQAYFEHNVRNAVRGRNDKKYLYSSIRKHGSNAFSIQPLCTAHSEELLMAVEKFFIKHFDSTNQNVGYNLTRGGDGVSGMKQSEYAKRRVSETQLGRTHSLEERETKRKLFTGNKLRLGLIPWNKNRQWSDETRKKMSESAKKRWKNVSPEALQKYKEVGKENADLRWNSDGK